MRVLMLPSPFPSGLATAVALLLGVGTIGCQHCRDFPVGDINHKYVVDPPHFCDPQLGCSSSFPAALQILIQPGDPETAPDGLVRIGREAYEHLFAGYSPGLTLDVVFATARPSTIRRHSEYADPRSPWFDIFFGYYEVTVDKAAWGRPFGYVSAERSQGIVAEDIVRLGKADWNFLSNHVYGVPHAHAVQKSGIDMGKVGVGAPATRVIAGFEWDVIDVAGVEVVSAYQADDSEKLEIYDELLTPLWRFSFGEHGAVEGHDQSFPTARTSAWSATPFWLGFARIHRAWALALLGSPREAIAEFGEALSAYGATGSVLGGRYCMVLLAEAHLMAGDAKVARDTLEGGLAALVANEDTFWDAEAERWRGLLAWLALHDAETAEAHFARSLEIAAAQGAHQLALRTAISRARLAKAAGRPLPRDALVFHVQTVAGHGDSPELRLARATLEQLA